MEKRKPRPPYVTVINGKRQCDKCLEWKLLSLFVKSRSIKCGRGNMCKECVNMCARQQRQLPGEKERRAKKWKQRQKEKGLGHTQHIIGNRKECCKCKIWKKLDLFNKHNCNSSGFDGQCKKCKSEEWAVYYKKNSERVLETARKNRPKHRERIIKNIERRKPKRNLDERERAKTDIQFKLNRQIRVSMCNSLRCNGSKNGRHWESLVGYTVEDLKKHLEKKFIAGMSWDNWGLAGWHIDHKIPISAFNFTDPSHTDFKRCWALKNLQPLWAVENMSKHDKLEKPFQPSLAI